MYNNVKHRSHVCLGVAGGIDGEGPAGGGDIEQFVRAVVVSRECSGAEQRKVWTGAKCGVVAVTGRASAGQPKTLNHLVEDVKLADFVAVLNVVISIKETGHRITLTEAGR